ncbi:hypothetical protein ACKWTF_007772 [Chironomus riparius]
MPAVIIKSPNSLNEYMMLEVQGDLESRNESVNAGGNFVGDLIYNKYGHPVLIIGHHILFGKEIKFEKPLAVIQKIPKQLNNDDEEEEEEIRFDETIINDTQPNVSLSILDTTVNVENRSKPQVEYKVLALIKKKLLFNQRPRPIISNVPKTN